jgi:hypothetical protein
VGNRRDEDADENLSDESINVVEEMPKKPNDVCAKLSVNGLLSPDLNKYRMQDDLLQRKRDEEQPHNCSITTTDKTQFKETMKNIMKSKSKCSRNLLDKNKSLLQKN